MGNLWIQALIAAGVSFLASLVLGPVIISWLTKLKCKQQILEYGPNWHQEKAGTPTMGGFIFFCGIILSAGIALAVRFDWNYFLMLMVALAYGAVGFVDDIVKVKHQRNQGLTELEKLVLQCTVAIVYLLVLNEMGSLKTEIVIPFAEITWNMPGWLYIPFIMLVMVGTTNAVNINDGLDGLASSVTLIVALFFVVIGLWLENTATVFFAAAIAGGLAAFLCFNHHPAKVFMGDTGSLFLGGAVSMLAIGLGMPLILVLVGLMYVLEVLSDIIQKASWKLLKRRFFKMAPLHHHLEMCGWSETKIVIVFSIITLVMSVIAFFSVNGL